MEPIDQSTNNGASKDEKKLGPLKVNGRDGLEVRSAEVQEIIGRPPHWLVRGGITGFMGVLVLVLAAASVIKYPEVITAPLELTAINEPKAIQSEINGKLIKLRFVNNSQVEEGEVLAWMESTASHKAVLTLSAQVDSMYRWLRQNKLRNIRLVQINRFTDLGELQTSFQTFEEAYRRFIMFLPGGFYDQKRQMLEQELKYIRQLLKKLKEQKEIQKVSIKLAQKEYEVQKRLAEKELTAPIDLAKAESKVASSRLPLLQTETAIINNYASQTAKKNELMELEQQIAEQRSIFWQALNTLKSTIDKWKAKYLITTPISGRLVYAGIIQENQTLEAGQNIAYIQPDNTQFIGEMMISQRSFGKIREGQKVLVRFSGYPDQEFGSVMGQIDYLSDFPVQDTVFFAKVTFPNGFITNYGQKLPPTNGMIGQAEIITQDMRLLERIFNSLTKNLR